MAETRKTFGPVLLLGLASGILAAVAGARPWVSGSSGRVDTSSASAAATFDTTGIRESPLAAALALVVLACWGVVLVTRGRVRRTVAALGAVAAIGALVTTVLAFWSLQDALTDALLEASGTDTARSQPQRLVRRSADRRRRQRRRHGPGGREDPVLAGDGHALRRTDGGGRARGARGQHRHLEGPRRGR
ncbi:Trp biosynthesis-associated membrane protein [Nocardioides sp. B-3]|nr:Trp biosynthesis-associated membrane protein [Nocardioides sp. B-3]UUZ58825.1 Trp biosynthesis-associated membrane protein [Nocardioides sp. B-3]